MKLSVSLYKYDIHQEAKKPTNYKFAINCIKVFNKLDIDIELFVTFHLES